MISSAHFIPSKNLLNGMLMEVDDEGNSEYIRYVSVLSQNVLVVTDVQRIYLNPNQIVTVFTTI